MSFAQYTHIPYSKRRGTDGAAADKADNMLMQTGLSKVRCSGKVTFFKGAVSFLSVFLLFDKHVRHLFTLIAAKNGNQGSSSGEKIKKTLIYMT